MHFWIRVRRNRRHDYTGKEGGITIVYMFSLTHPPCQSMAWNSCCLHEDSAIKMLNFTSIKTQGPSSHSPFLTSYTRPSCIEWKGSVTHKWNFILPMVISQNWFCCWNSVVLCPVFLFWSHSLGPKYTEWRDKHLSLVLCDLAKYIRWNPLGSSEYFVVRLILKGKCSVVAHSCSLSK